MRAIRAGASREVRALLRARDMFTRLSMLMSDMPLMFTARVDNDARHQYAREQRCYARCLFCAYDARQRGCCLTDYADAASSIDVITTLALAAARASRRAVFYFADIADV